jgi:hypothetical protein
MARVRWIAVSVLLPVLYAAMVLVVTRKHKQKPVYTLPEPTVITVPG